jgi:hypothetical protein
MSHRNALLVLVVGLMVLQSGLTLSQLSADEAASSSRGMGSIHVFRGGGGVRQPTFKPGPTSLSAAAVKNLAEMAGATPGTAFVKLSPQLPSVTSRGALVFDRPKLVETGQNYALWGPPQTAALTSGSEGALWLWLHPSTGHKYLIDCAVRSTSPNARFHVTGPAGTAPMKVDAIPAGQHLTFVLDAADNNWVSFQISGIGLPNKNGLPTASHVEWTFYSCEVTNL